MSEKKNPKNAPKSQRLGRNPTCTRTTGTNGKKIAIKRTSDPRTRCELTATYAFLSVSLLYNPPIPHHFPYH